VLDFDHERRSEVDIVEEAKATAAKR
jgi:hypothetical protein